MATPGRRGEQGLKGKATAAGGERDREYVQTECRGLNHKNSPQVSADFQLLWDPDPGGGLPKSSEPDLDLSHLSHRHCRWHHDLECRRQIRNYFLSNITTQSRTPP